MGSNRLPEGSDSMCVCVCVRAHTHAHTHSVMSDSLQPRQAPLCIGFSRQEYCNGCHFLLQAILLTQGWKSYSLCLLHWPDAFFTSWAIGEAQWKHMHIQRLDMADNFFFQKILWFAITNFILSWSHIEINFNLQNLLGYGIELCLPNRYVEILPPYTSECNLLWKQWCGICN